MLVWHPDHPNAGVNGYVRQHVAVMVQALGRPLRPGEKVHHLNGIRDDNRPENLELWTDRHPRGQRVADRIDFYLDFLRNYASDPAFRERIVPGVQQIAATSPLVPQGALFATEVASSVRLVVFGGG